MDNGYVVVDKRSSSHDLTDEIEPVNPYDTDLMSAVLTAEVDHRTVTRQELCKILKVKYEMTSSEASFNVKRFCRRMGVKTADAPLPRYWQLLAALGVAIYGFQTFGFFAGTPRHSTPSHLADVLGHIVEIAYSVAIVAFLAYNLRGGRLRRNLRVLMQIRPWTILQNAAVMAAVVSVALALVHFLPFLDRSWLYLLPGNNGRPTNIALVPLQIRYLAPIFVALFLLNVPAFARDEEFDYRAGTKNWRQGIWKSLRFGLAHFSMGVPIFGCLALSVGGLWFTHQYFHRGVDGAALHHTTYNVLVVVVLACVLLHILH